jgi:uncharacterized protein (DUF4415 family)
MKKTVQYSVNLSDLPPLTKAEKAEISNLSSKLDSDIDYSDIPQLDDSFWKNAVRNPFYKPTKKSTTVRVDSDVLMWLKKEGKGYQTRINTILRGAMIHDLNKHSS